MSEFHVEVVTIGKIEKHPNADSLSVTLVKSGYPVIIRTGEFQEGDKAVYVPIESMVPVTDPRFSFLANKDKNRERERVRAKKLRGIFSMGLLAKAEPSWTLGQNVQTELNIIKYEPPEPLSMGGENEKDPGFLPVYTDIEGLRKFPHLLKEGEVVVITEKLHGCVRSNVGVTMADGSSRRMKDVHVGEYVLGRDVQGLAVASQVLRKFDNGLTRQWLDVRVTNINAGRGISYRTLCCTPEHKIFSGNQNDFVCAGDLKVGDKVLVNRLDLELNPLQKEVLLGKMLGDGSRGVAGRAVVWGHKTSDKDYLDWTAKCLGPLAHPTESKQESGYGTEMLRRRTVNSDLVQDLVSEFYDEEDKKSVPEELELSPISLAFWYMDDGSLGHSDDQLDRANFAACAFTEADCQILIGALSRLGIDAIYYQSANPESSARHSRLRLNAESAERLFLLISPYVCASMQYKLPARYRGAPAWFPEIEHKPALVEQTVTRILARSENRARVDMETETSNYFAGGILVHNCNGRWLYQDDRLWVGSHNNIKREDPNNLWWKVAFQERLQEKLRNFPYIAIYGEVYGQVQDLKYGAKPNELKLALFDSLDTRTRHYHDEAEFVELCKALGLPRVPMLYHGPWSSDLRKLAEGNSTLAAHVREGFVVRPVKERFEQELGGRLLLKLVGEGYLLRKE